MRKISKNFQECARIYENIPKTEEFTRMSYDLSIRSCFMELRAPILVAGVPNINLRSGSSHLGLDRQI